MARTVGIVNPLDPANPIIEPRTFDPKLPSWFFEDQLPPNPLPCDWGPLPPLIEGLPLLQPCGSQMIPDATQGAANGGRPVALSLPFVATAQQSAAGGLTGLLMEAGLSDPRNPSAPLPGGLAGLLQQHMSGRSRSSK